MPKSGNKYQDMAIKIDKALKDSGIQQIRKAELKAKFNIPHDHASSVWVALCALGWRQSWFTIEKVN